MIETSWWQDEALAEFLLGIVDLRVRDGGVSLELDATAVLEYVAENFGPEDVYSERDLTEWATKNGCTRD